MGRSADLPRSSGEIDGDDTGCTVLHVDMDAFFASVEVRARPELRGKPVIVGGSEGRGVVAAASYEARAFGVRSAMSMAQAMRLCPRAVVIPPSRGRYTEASAAIMAVFASFTPHVEPLSLDEAFLDVAGAVQLFGRPADIARQIRQRVFAEQQLTCSVGIAPTKSIAKLASGSCKPNGLRVVSRAGVLDFLHPLPVNAIWGVGEKTAATLHRLGIRTVADLAATPTTTLRHALGPAAAEHLSALANGQDARAVEARQSEKSISTDRTLLHDLLTEEDVARELLRGAVEVGERLRAGQRHARTVGIKIRFADFTTVTRVRTLPEPTDASTVIYEQARELYRALRLDKPRVRLVGVKAENLVAADAATQLALDLSAPPRDPAAPRVTQPQTVAAAPRPRSEARSASPPPGDRRQPAATDRAIDELAARFGRSVVGPASLLRKPAIVSDPRRLSGAPAAEPAAAPEAAPSVKGRHDVPSDESVDDR